MIEYTNIIISFFVKNGKELGDVETILSTHFEAIFNANDACAWEYHKICGILKIFKGNPTIKAALVFM